MLLDFSTREGVMGVGIGVDSEAYRMVIFFLIGEVRRWRLSGIVRLVWCSALV